MIPIILVDDEPWAREHIKRHIPLKEWGFSLIAEASNGEEALRLCETARPKIALIDITMPVMDGLKLLKLLRERHPEIRCIMLTAHREFGFAQQAIQYGATGYILKAPDNMADVRAALDKATDELERETQIQQNETSHRALVQNYQYPLRRDFLKQLLAGVLRQTDEIAERGNSMGMRLDAASYALILWRADRLDKLRESYKEKDLGLLEFSMLEVVRECLNDQSEQPFELLPVSFGCFCLLLKGSIRLDQTRESYQTLIRRLHLIISKPLKHYLNLSLAVAAGIPFASLETMKEQYVQAVQLLEHRFYQNEPWPVFSSSVVPFQDLPNRLWDDLTERWRSCVEAEQDEQLASFLSFTENTLRDHKPTPGKVLNWLSNLQLHILSGKPADWPVFGLEPCLTDELVLLETWYRHKQRGRHTSPVVERPEIARAKAYIREHLDRELSLERIAEHVQISPSYLGQLFKKETGSTVFEYLNEQRIDLAKQYLISGEYRNYELALKVGCPNYSYFSTLFKKLTGMSPSEFKRQHRAYPTPP
jgi:two-component system response regulator YesN